MFKDIQGVTPNYFSERIDINFDVYDYDAREIYCMNVYLRIIHKGIFGNSCWNLGGKL